MPDPMDSQLRHQLFGIGIVDTDEQNRVLDAAKKCTATGMVVGGGWAVLGAPALGPGVLAGFLTGFVTGTATCMGLSLAGRKALRDLGTGDLEAP